MQLSNSYFYVKEGFFPTWHNRCNHDFYYFPPSTQFMEWHMKSPLTDQNILGIVVIKWAVVDLYPHVLQIFQSELLNKYILVSSYSWKV